MENVLSTETKTRRWEYHREIKNLMGRYMLSLLTLRDAHIYEDFWAKSKEDVCLGFYNGWYLGASSIQAYYAAWDVANQKALEKMKKLFPDKLENPREKIYGAGAYNSKPISTGVIEIAGDEETAQGLWYSRGSMIKLTEAGTVSYWTWGVYAVDFVRENGAWKLWHLKYLEDICCPSGQSWGAPNHEYPAVPGFEDAQAIYQDIPEPDEAVCLWEQYHPNRPFTKLPPFPMPYEHFQEEISYGRRKEA
jgi:hypothetical protein